MCVSDQMPLVESAAKLSEERIEDDVQTDLQRGLSELKIGGELDWEAEIIERHERK